ncbi:hypothetical protein [Brevibacillus daliensis]|uniref:hypothetical protein n=1 Tax=Brevibacillus daliensis TaxID=2892995 RepID=UPI001E2B294F|nr:hypothetical protein [Brevibacillus daliensis]
MIKFALGTATAALALVGVVTGVHAEEQVTPPTTTTNIQQNGDGPIVIPYISTPVLSKKLANTTMSEPFYIQPGQGWVKVYVQNNGTNDISLSVTQGKANGTVKISGTIPAGKTKEFFSSTALAVGDHYVNLSSGRSEMTGSLSVRIASTREELNN